MLEKDHKKEPAEKIYKQNLTTKLSDIEIIGCRRRKWQPTPVVLPGEFHEQRSLAGYTVHGVAESGMTEQLSLTLILNSALPKYHGEYNSF